MELFTLGAGRGYTERDVREQARALTGWRARLGATASGMVNFRFDRELPRRRRASGSSASAAASTGATPAGLVRRPPAHPSFFVDKLWSYFIPTPPRTRTRARAAAALRRARDYDVRPVVEAILRHPALYEGPRMVKPPAVYVAGLLRALRRADRHRRLDLDLADERARRCSRRRTSPAGTTRAGSTRATWRGRWIAAN